MIRAPARSEILLVLLELMFTALSAILSPSDSRVFTRRVILLMRLCLLSPVYVYPIQELCGLTFPALSTWST